MRYRLAAPALLAGLLLAVAASAQEPDAKSDAPAAPKAPAKSTFKPGGLPTVRVMARPLPGDRMAVTIFFFNRATRRLQHHTAVGSLDEVDRKVSALVKDGKIPPNVQDFVTVALNRLRSRQAARTAAPSASVRQDELDTKDKKN
jgi:hypothetical protein